MVKVIMHGCNGHMGQVISGLIKDDPEIEIVAGRKSSRLNSSHDSESSVPYFA